MPDHQPKDPRRFIEVEQYDAAAAGIIKRRVPLDPPNVRIPVEVYDAAAAGVRTKLIYVPVAQCMEVK